MAVLLEGLIAADNWAANNKMKFSHNRTKLMHRQLPFSLPLVHNGFTINPAEKVRYLGVSLDSKMTSKHRFGLWPGPNCRCEMEETVLHFLFECPLYSNIQSCVQLRPAISVNEGLAVPNQPKMFDS